jgi:uncharacterized protein YjbI with pentapeptide repeats
MVLTACRLDGVNLTGAKLSGATLTSCSARNVVLQGADLSGAVWQTVQAPGCNLAAVNLERAQLLNCDLSASVWMTARAPAARIVRCAMGLADFSYAQLDGAAITQCDLTDANLHGVDQSRSSWDGCVMRRVRETDRVRLYAETWKPPD